MTQLFEKTGTSLVFAIPPAARLQLGQATGHTTQPTTKQGKNLFGPKAGTITVNGVTCTVNSDGTITLDGVASGNVWITLTTELVGYAKTNSVPWTILEQGKPYIFSETVVSGTKSGTFYHTIRDTVSTAIPGSCIMNGSVSNQFIAGTPQTTDYSTSLYPGMLNLYAASGTVFDHFQYRIQVEQAASATPWEPFIPDSPSPDYPAPISGTTALTVSDGGSQSQIIALPQTLYNLPDGAADSYDVVSGKGTAAASFYTYMGSSSESWKFSSSASTHRQKTALFWMAGLSNIFCNGGNTLIGGFCDRFKIYNADQLYAGDNVGIAHDNYSIFISIEKSRLSGWSDSWTDDQKITAFKAWLSANPVTVLYELATPQTISGEAIEPFAWPYREAKITTDAGGTVSLSVYNKWTEPKMDWKDTDFFNLDPDYARIKGNIEYIKEFSEAMYDEFSIAEMGDFTIDELPFDTFLNNIVDNVTALEENLFKPPQDQDMIRYAGGGNGWDYKQLNIIESNLLRLKNAMESQWSCIPQMAFSMGTGVDEF